MPFGVGRRIFYGMPFANLNMAHILAHLLLSFDWHLPEDQKLQALDRTATFAGVTSPKKHPLMATEQPRLPAFLC